MQTPPAVVRALHADERGFAATSDPRYARHRQALLRAVGRRPALAAAVVRLAPGERDDVLARRDLEQLASGSLPLRARIRVGRAPAAPRLLRWYREGERRFGVRWQLLAAVNFVESAFCKVRNTSTAGAQGPMQFLPATWRAYGLGGDVHDPHDAILGAANYLAANGGARDARGALYHYNHSSRYVDAVLRYARRITHVRYAFAEYYAWAVYVRTPTGVRRYTP
ncbi:MAG TPA: lytic transglycosylase domain-containing protein [Gaiellaceae bacterium]|nr:lytic transglycosylase domain-containing protein [Gaiellaceae bacterium]